MSIRHFRISNDGKTIINSSDPAINTSYYFYTRSNMRLSIGMEKVLTVTRSV